MNSYDTLNIREEDKILIITIDRPKSLNALNDQVFKDLIQLFTIDLSTDEYIGVIVTGSGDRAFVAGADIKEFLSLDVESATQLAKRGHDIFSFIEQLTIPVIAAVNGFALGGGCELAMACHLRVAGENAKFGQPEVNLGIVPGYGGTQRLPRLIGRGKALELLMTGDMIDAKEAYRLGLANHVVTQEELIPTAKKLITKIAKKAPLAIAGVIEAVNDYYDHEKDGFQTEIDQFGTLGDTDDFKEGATAFIEKRKPSWKGK